MGLNMNEDRKKLLGDLVELLKEEDFKKEQKKQPIQMTNDQMPKNTKAKKERDFVQIIAEAKNRALVKFDFSKKNVRKSQY